MMVSVIISIYKKLDNLELILLGLERQSFKDFEVIIAEDNYSSNTIAFLEEARKKYFFPIQHVSQEDKGFRKCRILNEALRISKGEKTVFLDGDCIPHKHFLKMYNRYIQQNIFFSGRRIMLTEKISQQLKTTKNLQLLKWLYLLLYRCTHLKYGLYIPFYPRRTSIKKRGIVGCNMGGTKKDLLEVNGFDEDYMIPAVGEDSDLQWRLEKKGVSIQAISNYTIVYHLYHKLIHDPYSEEQIKNRNHMYQKQQIGNFFCKNGLEKI
ncbi:MAG: glycosyltransferase [Chitinophagaceae bacterium]